MNLRSNLVGPAMFLTGLSTLVYTALDYDQRLKEYTRTCVGLVIKTSDGWVCLDLKKIELK